MKAFFAYTPNWLKALLFTWVRLETPPKLPNQGSIAPSNRSPHYIYITEHQSIADALVVRKVAEQLSLPQRLPTELGLGERLPILCLGGKASINPQLERLLSLQKQHPDLELKLVPVAVYWGRRPKKDKPGVLAAVLSEAWQNMGMVRKFFTILVNGRHTYVELNQPLSLADLLAQTETLEHSRLARKANRILRMHFRLVRTRLLGPDLSHRRMLINRLLQAKSVRAAIEAQARAKKVPVSKVTKQARHYLEEIAANLSYPTVRLMDVVLTWLWNRIYNGIRVNQVEAVHEAAKDSTLIYVPCHRSHIDYLLMSYSLYYNGLNLPHIAAGVNLNMPVVGSILRRSGAFFLRRSFKGDKLYAAVFNEYLRAMFSYGYAIEYYIEGGRSRTGRMLDPKGGLISMSVRSYLNHPSRPIKFVPVYIGYERIFEEKSYLNELRGHAKQKESLWGLLGTLRRLRNYGQASLNFGKPIDLAEFLNQQHPNWQQAIGQPEARLEWFAPAMDVLGTEIITRISQAAALNPVNLLAAVMLATPKQAITEEELLKQLQLMHDMQQQLPFSPHISLAEGQPQEWLAYGLKMQLLTEHSQSLGKIYSLNADMAIRLSYYRNNIQHLYALPSLLACLFSQGKPLGAIQVERRILAIYPFVKKELFLPWTEQELQQQISAWLDYFCQQGLLIQSQNQYQPATDLSFSNRSMWLLAQLMMPTLERYYLTLAILMHSGSGQLSAGELERLGQQVAERLSLLNGLNAPEFFDRSLFKKFIQGLRSANILSTNDAGKLVFEQDLLDMMDTARDVLRRSVRQTILQVAQTEQPATEAKKSAAS